MPLPSPTPRLRPTAAPGVTSATLSALVDRGSGDFEVFESAAAQLLGVRHAVVVGSGRAGLAAILTHVGCRPDDEIVVPSYTAPCVPGFLRARGYRVTIATVCPRRLVVTPDSIAAAVGPRSRAVLPTHVEGVTSPTSEIVAALPSSVSVIEDAAHALGAGEAGKPVGSASAGAFHSFGKGKHLNTMFGGMVVTDDAYVASAVRRARDLLPPPARTKLLKAVLIEVGLAAATHPTLYPYVLHPVIRTFERIGIDLPTLLFEDRGGGDPTTVERRPPASWGKLGLTQLAGFAVERDRRRRLATTLRKGLQERGICHQEANDAEDHPLFLTVRHRRRDDLHRALLAEGVDTQPTWMRSIAGDDGRIDPVAEAASREGLYLPLHRGVDPQALLNSLDRALKTVRG